MRKTIVLHFAAALFAFACTSQTTVANGQEAAEEKEQATFSIDAPAIGAKAGAKAEAKIEITPAKGYKWNENFPASFKIVTESPKSVTFTKRDFDKAAFRVENKHAFVAVPFEAKSAGEETIDATATFSVCNDETCLIFRNEKVSLKVKVQ